MNWKAFFLVISDIKKKILGDIKTLNPREYESIATVLIEVLHLVGMSLLSALPNILLA